MEKSLVGDIVVLPFPHTDLTPGKRRPALVVATLPGNDLILCQITSQPKFGPSVELLGSDFISGQLSVTSYVRPTRLFTVEQSVILYAAARVSSQKISEVKRLLRELFA